MYFKWNLPENGGQETPSVTQWRWLRFTSASALAVIHSHAQYIGYLYGPNNNLDQALTFYLPCQEYDKC